MTLKETVVQWDNSWRYDYWWRQKYKIAFNSKAHQEANQIDIAFEYMEEHLSNKAMEKIRKEEEMAKRFKKDGWISKREFNKSKLDRAFAKLDLSKL